MSPDPERASPRIRGRLLWIVLAIVALLALAIALFLPFYRIGDLRVEAVQRIGAGDARRIAVAFSVDEDVAALRRRLRIGYIAAKLSACDDGDIQELEPIAQDGGYLTDDGRVLSLGPVTTGGAGRHRYRALFFPLGGKDGTGRFRLLGPADIPGGLCFSLHGASMWGAGLLWSKKVRLALH